MLDGGALTCKGVPPVPISTATSAAPPSARAPAAAMGYWWVEDAHVAGGASASSASSTSEPTSVSDPSSSSRGTGTGTPADTAIGSCSSPAPPGACAAASTIRTWPCMPNGDRGRDPLAMSGASAFASEAACMPPIALDAAVPLRVPTSAGAPPPAAMSPQPPGALAAAQLGTSARRAGSLISLAAAAHLVPSLQGVPATTAPLPVPAAAASEGLASCVASLSHSVPSPGMVATSALPTH
mmetsp:Transcript_27809/g.88520  ORF Transcript_27809/g.88520 Transcript_27809/m.88520 type:complete len:240 (-) Transcript_27809:349-1068(-)